MKKAVCFLATGMQKKCVFRRGFLLFGVTLGTLLFGTEPIKAGDIWDGYVKINDTWYNVGGANNKQYPNNINTGGAQDLNRALFNNLNLGTVNFGAFGISGFSVMGWTGYGESVGEGGLNYKIWKNGTTEPSYSNYFKANGGNYAFGGSNYNQNSTSQVTQLIGADWINGDTYSLKTQSYTTINSSAKFYEATATLVINGARQLINSNSDTTQSSAYNTSSTGGLVKQGTGTLTLAVDNSNSTTGQKGEIYIDAGTIAVNAGTGVSGNNALGGSTTVVRLGGESGASNAGFTLANNGGLDVGRTIVVRSGSSGTKTISSSNSSGVNTLSGVIALDHDVTISGGSGTGELNISGAISDGAGVGNYGARFSAGTVKLSGGVSNTGITLYTVANGATLHLAKSNADAVQSTLTIENGGTVNFSASNQLGDSTVVNNNGTLATGNNSDTFNTLNSSGNITGSGTLTAATYALNGGTVSANLGTGTVTASSGTTLLSGTSAAGTVNVSSGLLSLVSANRLANSAAVAVSSGAELAVGGNNTVGSLVSGGTVSGAGTLTAASYTLNGGTVSANLGTGTLNASSGETFLSGTSDAGTVNVTGTGLLRLVSANRLADAAAVAVSSGTLGVGGSDTVGSLAASGTGVVTVASGTTLTANGNSSITGSARATGGTVAIANNSKLTLANSSTTTTSDLSIGSGSTLAGTGGTSGQIKGSGLLSPGNSPGILTSGSVDLTGGIDFAFEFTAAGAPTYSLAGNSKNDLLHLTSGSTPFSGSFTTGNTVSFYFNDAGLSASLASVTRTTYLGGFFVDSSSFDIAGLLSNATKQYFIAAAGGSTSFNGVSYNLMSSDVASRIILSNVNQSGADFTTGTVNGTVLGVMAVPEPSSGSLLLAGIGSLLFLRRFRKNA